MDDNDMDDSVLAQIGEVIGHERALLFVGALPPAGKRPWRKCFHVPKRVAPDHWLVARLGWKDAQKMARAFGGMILQPSNVRFWARDVRNDRIVDLWSRGVGASVIAEELEISESRVREVIAGRRVSNGSNQKGART